MTETNILFNSNISDAKNGARLFSMDSKDIFLHNPMLVPEYMKVHYIHFPADIRKIYNLDQLVHTDNYIYIKINKGIYDLKQAAILVYEFLSLLLEDADYVPIIGTLGLWKHSIRKITFCLCVDDFCSEILFRGRFEVFKRDNIESANMQDRSISFTSLLL